MATVDTILETLDIWKNVGKNPALVIVGTVCMIIVQIFMFAAGKRIRKSKAESKKNEQKQQNTTEQEAEASDGYSDASDRAKKRRQ